MPARANGPADPRHPARRGGMSPQPPPGLHPSHPASLLAGLDVPHQGADARNVLLDVKLALAARKVHEPNLAKHGPLRPALHPPHAQAGGAC